MHTISIYAVGSDCYRGVRTMHSPNLQFPFSLRVNTTVCKNVTLHHSPLERVYLHEPRQPMCALEWPHSGGLLKQFWSHSTRLKLNTVLSAILLVGSRVLIKLCMPVSHVFPSDWLALGQEALLSSSALEMSSTENAPFISFGPFPGPLTLLSCQSRTDVLKCSMRVSVPTAILPSGTSLYRSNEILQQGMRRCTQPASATFTVDSLTCLYFSIHNLLSQRLMPCRGKGWWMAQC